MLLINAYIYARQFSCRHSITTRLNARFRQTGSTRDRLRPGQPRVTTPTSGSFICVMDSVQLPNSCSYTWCTGSSVSTHQQEGNVLFNDALNTFYLRLYGVGHMVKDHSDSERGNPPHGLLFLINSKGSFICIIPET